MARQGAVGVEDVAALDAALRDCAAIEIPVYILDDVIADYLDRLEKNDCASGASLRSSLASDSFLAQARQVVCEVSLISTLAKTISDTAQFKLLAKRVLAGEKDDLLSRVRCELLREAFGRGLLDGLVSAEEKSRRMAIVMAASNTAIAAKRVTGEGG